MSELLYSYQPSWREIFSWAGSVGQSLFFFFLCQKSGITLNIINVYCKRELKQGKTNLFVVIGVDWWSRWMCVLYSTERLAYCVYVPSARRLLEVNFRGSSGKAGGNKYCETLDSVISRSVSVGGLCSTVTCSAKHRVSVRNASYAYHPSPQLFHFPLLILTLTLILTLKFLS